MKWRSTPCTKNRDHSATSYDGPIDLSGTSTTTTHNVENCVPRSFRSVEFCRGFIIFRFFFCFLNGGMRALFVFGSLIHRKP